MLFSRWTKLIFIVVLRVVTIWYCPPPPQICVKVFKNKDLTSKY